MGYPEEKKKKREKGREERGEFRWKMTLVSDIRILDINQLLI